MDDGLRLTVRVCMCMYTYKSLLNNCVFGQTWRAPEDVRPLGSLAIQCRSCALKGRASAARPTKRRQEARKRKSIAIRAEDACYQTIPGCKHRRAHGVINGAMIAGGIYRDAARDGKRGRGTACGFLDVSQTIEKHRKDRDDSLTLPP